MIYVIRCRKLVQIIFDEQEKIKVQENDKEHEQFPLEKICLEKFRGLNSRYAKKQTAARIFSIAQGEDYIKSLRPKQPTTTLIKMPAMHRVAITPHGIKLLTFSGFANELARSVGAIAPIVISLVALTISIITLLVK